MRVGSRSYDFLFWSSKRMLLWWTFPLKKSTKIAVFEDSTDQKLVIGQISIWWSENPGNILKPLWILYLLHLHILSLLIFNTRMHTYTQSKHCNTNIAQPQHNCGTLQRNCNTTATQPQHNHNTIVTHRANTIQTGLSRMIKGEVGGWGRDPKKCTGRDWGMGSSTI